MAITRAKTGAAATGSKGEGRPGAKKTASRKTVGNRKKEAYEERLEAQLREWNAQIELLQAKIAKAKANAKIEYSGLLKDVKAKRRIAQRKLRDLQKTGEGAWEDLREGMEDAWAQLRDGLRNALSRFK